MSFQCGCLRLLVTGLLLLPITGCEKSAAEKIAERQLQDTKENDEEIEPPRPQSLLAEPTPQRSLADRKASPEKVVDRHSNGSLKFEYNIYVDDNGKPVKHGEEAQWYEDGKDNLQGQWVDGQRDGTWVAWHKTGQKWAEGEYRNSQPVGQWNYWDKEGKSAGARQDGVRVGVWRHWNKEGNTFAIGEYNNGIKNGKWLFCRSPESHPSMDIEFKDGIWHGNVTVYSTIGDPVCHYAYKEGTELRNKRAMYMPIKDRFGFPKQERIEAESGLGFYTTSMPALKPDVLEFTAGELGPFEPVDTVYEPYRKYFPNGQLRTHGQFRPGPDGKDIFHGEFVTWFSDGKKERSITYSDGLKHGQNTEWYENGEKKREGLCQDGKAVGQWMFWYASGRKKMELDFTNRTARLWEANGQEASTANYEQLAKGLLD